MNFYFRLFFCLLFLPIFSSMLLQLLLLLLSRFSHVRLCATPQMAAHQAPLSLDSPGKNTGVGCHCLLQCRKVKSESEVTQSCPTLATPWTAAHQAPPSTGFSRQEYWSGVPLSVVQNSPKCIQAYYSPLLAMSYVEKFYRKQTGSTLINPAFPKLINHEILFFFSPFHHQPHSLFNIVWRNCSTILFHSILEYHPYISNVF